MNTMFASPRQHRLRMGGILAAGVLSVCALSAQSPLARIQSAINSSETVVLPGSQHPLALPQYDAGRMPSGSRMNGVTLYFSHSAAQQADLDALIAAQQDPASPQYHKWLTPEQFAARFGMAQSDIDKVQGWLEQQGFSIDLVMRSHTGIRFSGTAGQVESAFGTEMHYYTVDGARHFAPSTGLSLPAALSGVVAGVRNLDTFRPKAQHIPVRGNFTSGSSGNNFFAPGDIVTAYDMQPLYSAGIDGTGQTIAIMGQSFTSIADVEAFQNAAGLPKKDPQLVLVPGTGADNTPSTGDEGESSLDLEWSGAMAPGANVVFVYTGSDNKFGVYDSTQYAVDNRIGNIISVSYSSCETQLNPTNLAPLENIVSQAAAQGQTVMAASGDQGSTSCYGNTNLTLAQQQAIVVNYPASSAYVTGVGGTEARATDVDGGSNVSTYWKSTSGTDIVNSLIQYLPEVAWNDSPTSGCPAGSNCLGATGGGKSSLIAQPKWQTDYFTAVGESNPDSAHRLVPDIALYSSAQGPGYLYCTSDSTSWGTGQTSSCTSGFRDTASNLLTVAGGTSFATPIFAGMMALLNQQGNYVTGAGLLNTELYSLASNSTTYSTVFHDVTSGNNYCLTPSNCASTGSTSGYAATANYDMVTGLGSFDVTKLAAAWPMSTNTLLGSKVAVQPATSPVAAGTDNVVTITVTSQTGATIPTGSVTLQIDGGTAWGAGGTTVASQPLDANGKLTYTANFTTAGTHQVLAMYGGDTTHAAATGVAAIVITGGGGGAGTIAMAATDVTVKRGSSGSSTITVTPGSGYTGTVKLAIDFGSSNSTLGNLCYSFTTTDNTGKGTVQVTGASAVTTQLSLDTNASDCSSATGGVKKPNMKPLKVLMAGTGQASNQPEHHGNWPAGLAFAGLLMAGLLGRHARKLRNVACVIALLAAGLALSACGSSSGGSSGPSDPPKGTYTGTVTGTDSVTTTITSKTTFTFTIN